MTNYNSFWEAAPVVAGGAVLAGGGARVVKGLLDLVRRKDPESAPVTIDPTEAPIVSVPVEVTPEEAAELRRKGVKVKKQAAFNIDPSEALLLGALGTGAAIGGWKLTDSLVDEYRKSEATAKRDQIRKRIKSILAGTPEQADKALHAQMKAAEAVHFDKTAEASLQNMVNPFAALLGGALVVSGVKAYNEAVVSGESPGKIKALKAYLKRMKTVTPTATLVPVEAAPPSGSPAQQAAANAQG